MSLIDLAVVQTSNAHKLAASCRFPGSELSALQRDAEHAVLEALEHLRKAHVLLRLVSASRATIETLGEASREDRGPPR